MDEHEMNATAHFDEEVQEIFLRYSWPGNVRQLEGVVERAVVHAGVRNGHVEIHASHLPARLREPEPSEAVNRAPLTVELVEATLRQGQGNRSEAARQLGVHRNTIARRAPSEKSAS
jgi:DNA-binding NtrC family response regulator